MVGEVPLFDLPPGQVPLPILVPPPRRVDSSDTRRTARHRAALERGVHPLGLALLRDAPDPADRTAPGPRCGSCDHRYLQVGTAKTYFKCEVRHVTRGPATDVRMWWPACVWYQPEAHSVDA